MSRFQAFCLLWSMLCSLSAAGEQLTVAVASNFRAPMRQLVTEFEQSSNHQLRIVVGSSGKLFAQIVHGAPYDLLFSADQKGPRLLAQQGLADADTQFSYAIGGLVLWSTDPQRVDDQGRVLIEGNFKRLAIANPQIAPYGVAALQLLERLGVYDQVASRLVLGANIAQTYQFICSGNADIGLVAKSQLFLHQRENSAIVSSFWMIPDHLYEPIRQDAITLNRALKNAAAMEFMEFINSDQARSMIAGFGYRLSEPT